MKSNKSINFIGISGSLTSTSSNTSLLRTLAEICPLNVTIRIWKELDTLPHFNPEITGEITAVNNFRKLIKDADGVIFSTPEYAFGVPGVLKNALDWMVSSGELNRKPVIAISASPLHSGGEKALASLLHTLTALGTYMTADSSLSIANIKNKLGNRGEITDPVTLLNLEFLLKGLIKTTISPSHE